MKKVRSITPSSKSPSSTVSTSVPSSNPPPPPGASDVAAPAVDQDAPADAAGAASPLPAPLPAQSPRLRGPVPPAPPNLGDDAGQPPINIIDPPARRPEPPEPPPRPQLAIRSDRIILLGVDDMKDRDLRGRRLWTCVELTAEEAQLVHKRGMDAEHEVAAMIISAIPKQRDPDQN